MADAPCDLIKKRFTCVRLFQLIKNYTGYADKAISDQDVCYTYLIMIAIRKYVFVMTHLDI